MILAIDPGNTYSAFCVVDERNYEPLYHDKVLNTELMNLVDGLPVTYYNAIVERVASYGMAVGREVFETCEWIGRYSQMLEDRGHKVAYIYRMEEKRYICHDSKAKDSNIRQALIDRFAKFDLKNGKGTKDNPDWFYGFKADEWAAYAVAVTYLDKWREEHNGNALESTAEGLATGSDAVSGS